LNSFEIDENLSFKRLAPLFIYQILQNKTNSIRHLKRADIIDILNNYPYDIEVDGRTVTNIIKALCDYDCHVFSKRGAGFWYDAHSVNVGQPDDFFDDEFGCA